MRLSLRQLALRARRKRKPALLLVFAFGAQLGAQAASVPLSSQGCLAIVNRQKIKMIEMSDYNGAAKTYWFVMVAAGGTLLVWSSQHCLAFSLAQLATFGGLL